MKLEQVSRSCYAVLNERNRLCDSNSGLINRGGGVVVDTQADLPHARRMIELFSGVWKAMPSRVVNTHEDGDHVWGNQLFDGAEIIGHRSARERVHEVANPAHVQRLTNAARGFLTGQILKLTKPALWTLARQLNDDYDFRGIQPTAASTLVDDTLDLDLDGLHTQLIHVGPGHQVGDTIVHVPEEGVVFSGDVVFRDCTPLGWSGRYADWLSSLDRILELQPEVVVPGHGPVCGPEGVVELRGYLEFVLAEARSCFERGLTSFDAALQIDLGPYAKWRAPARLYMNVERAYREFRGEPPDTPWDSAAIFTAIYRLAKARGMDVEF